MPVRNFEPLNAGTDIATTRTFLHEAIPLTGTLISGTYGTFPNDDNIKNYVHGMFQSVYDYPYLSSSANHIFDLTVGYDETSPLSASTATQNNKKINIYNEFSQVLLGFTGSSNKVRVFESDLVLDLDNTMKEVFVISFSRLLNKDQIKKGSFEIQLGTGAGWDTPFSITKTLTDKSASLDDTGINSTMGGDYGVLYSSSSITGAAGKVEATGSGIIFYQAGICVLTASLFDTTTRFYDVAGTTYNVRQCLVSASMSGSCDALRHRIKNIQYNNTTEINSTIYFCRVPHNKFNYSSNPTYVTGSKIRVKNVAADNPISYITTVGLYSAANELLAVAKLSEPLKKTPSNELTIRVRLDY